MTYLDFEFVHLLGQGSVLSPQGLELLQSGLGKNLELGTALLSLVRSGHATDRDRLCFWCLRRAGIGRRVSRAIRNGLCRRSRGRLALGIPCEALLVHLHLLLV